MNSARSGPSRIFLVTGFSVLSGFAGVGTAWLFAGMILPKRRALDFMADNGSILIAAAVVGIIVGLVLSIQLFKNRPAVEQQEIERKFIGRNGAAFFFGIPMFFFSWSLFFMEPLAQRIGVAGAAITDVLLLMLLTGLAMYFSDRIPRRLATPLGLLGWLLTFAVFCLFGWISTQPTFGYH
jgi:hypothetical protein